MLSFFPRDVLDEILNLIESVSEGFPSYSYRPFRVLGKELGHEVPTSQMQHNADYKVMDKKRSMLPIV